MKALRFDRTGSLDSLTLAEVALPTLNAGEALIKVHAAGLNPSDVKNVLGRFPYTTLPRTPGRDFAGIVEQGPAEWLGREVWGTGRDLGFFNDGSHAEYLKLPVGGLSAKPQSLSFVEAASCGVPFTTALDALDRAGVQAKTKLLVIGAAGSVGSAAVALARLRGAEVVAAVRRPEQFAALQAAGITALKIDDIAQLAGTLKSHFPAGAEVVFDTTGFCLPNAVEALATFGRIAVIAAPVDGHVNTPILNLYRRGGSIVGINSLLYDCAACAAMLTTIAKDFDQGRLQAPKNLIAWNLEDGIEAYSKVNSGSMDKIVLTTNKN